MKRNAWPEQCWGPAPSQHQKYCHPKRPKCRWRRAKHLPKYKICECGIYHFPHRAGSGLCGNPERFEAALRDPHSHFNRRSR